MNSLKSWIIGIVATLLAGQAVAQPNSATLEAQAEKRDSNDVLFLLAESRKFEGEQATNYAEQAVSISKMIKFDRGTDMGYDRLIKEYQRRGDPAQVLRTRLQFGKYLQEKGRYGAILENVMQLGELYLQNKLYVKATTAFIEADSLDQGHRLGRKYEIDKHLGYAAQNAGLEELAWKRYGEAKRAAKDQRRSNDLLWILQQEAALAHQAKDYGKAYAIHQQIYHLADSLGNESYRTVAMNNMGYAAKFAGLTAKAVDYFSDALVRAKRANNLDLQGKLLQSMGIMGQVQHDYKNAILHLRQSADAYLKAGNVHDQAQVLDLLSLLLYQNKQAYEALMASNSAVEIAEKRHFPDVLQASLNTRSTIYESLNEYESALADYRRHLRIQDSLNAIARRQQDAILNQQFILEKLEKEIKLLYISDEMKDSENAKLMAEKEALAQKSNAFAKEAENEKLTKNKAQAELELERRQHRLQQQTAQITSLNQERERQQLLLDFEKLKADSVRQANVQLEIARRNQDLELENQKLILSKESQKLAEEQARTRNLFIFLGVLGLVLLVIVVILLQLRSKNRRIARQNLVILENQQVIQTEKEKSDALLLNILPAVVAAELKEKGTSTPRQFEAVSVLFTDFVNFTKISELLSPTELIATLDKVFLEFDMICERHGLSRIKTIGDSYMCVSGLPEPHPNHAANAVKAGLEMVRFIEQFNAVIPDPSKRWNVRIGINSGPVVAGVVGIKKFAYDIWGDSVNTASRMESSGEPGKVNISGSTHALVADQFRCTYRGKISAKNKGEVDMYFVERE